MWFTTHSHVETLHIVRYTLLVIYEETHGPYPNTSTRVYLSWGDVKWMIIVHPKLFCGYPYPFHLTLHYQLHKDSDWQHTSWCCWVCLLPFGTSKSKGELHFLFQYRKHLRVTSFKYHQLFASPVVNICMYVYIYSVYIYIYLCVATSQPPKLLKSTISLLLLV